MLSADNPFWRRDLRRTGRRGDPTGWWPALAFVGGALGIWFGLGPNLEPWSAYFDAWDLLLGYHAGLVALAVGVPAWRMLVDLRHEGNVTALRLATLRPLEAVAALALHAVGAGVRAVLVGLPVYLALSLLPGPAAPPAAGVLGVLALVLVYALFLAASGGAASTRSRQATVDDWTDFIFNVRTLAAVFLNPAWVFLVVLTVLRRGADLAVFAGAARDWFGHPLSPLLLALPVGLWAWRQLAGLAGEIYDESPPLAWRVVAGWAAAYVTMALLVVGFCWGHGFEDHALAVWWEMAPTQRDGARLLLALLLLAAVPLPMFAVHAEALASRLRTVNAERDQPLPGPSALVRALAAGTVATLVPWVVYFACLAMGGWSWRTAGVGFLARSAQLWLAASTASGAYLILLMLTVRLPRTTRELAALAVALPPLAGPFVMNSSAAAARWLAGLSPFTALLWLPPDAASGSGMTGGMNLPLPWPQVVAVQVTAALVLSLIAARFLLRGGARPAPVAVGRRWSAGERNPILAADILLLRRRGWLLSPMVMAVMPALALAYVRLHDALLRTVTDVCGLVLWHGIIADTGQPLQHVMPIVVGTIAAQLVLHPAGLAGVRSFHRDHEAGRLDPLWLTPTATRTIVLGRYLGVTTPFALFLVVFAGPLVGLGVWLGRPLLGVAGWLHWLALTAAVPALVLAATTRGDRPGQGWAALLAVVLLEAGRMGLSAALPAEWPVDRTVLVAHLAFVVAALGATWLALRQTELRLRLLRAGDRP